MATGLTRLSSRHVTSLDGFRGIALLLVFARHYGLSGRIAAPWVRLLERWGQGGWAGVDLFFALSGLLITGILLDTAGHPHYFRNFIARRALRIFPLYYGVFLLLLLLTPVLHLAWRPGHWLYLLYLGNFAYALDVKLTFVRPAVGLFHLWSLAVEEQFYLIWPGVIWLVARGRRRRLLPLCLGLSLIALLLRIALVERLVPIRAFTWAYAMLPTHMDGLLYGAVAALAIREWRMARIVPVARGLALGAAAVLGWVYFTAGPDIYSVAMTLVGYPALALLFSSILVLALRDGSWMSRVGNVRAFRFFGRYSYGMYMFHVLFNPLTAPLLAWSQARLHSQVLGGFLYVAEILAGTTVLAVLSYHLYERHWLGLKSRFAERVASKPRAVAS